MKIEVRCWLDQTLVKKLDSLIKEGKASSRSEAVRRLLVEHFSAMERLERRLKEQEERIRRLEARVLG